jgi:hypothetical protein
VVEGPVLEFCIILIGVPLIVSSTAACPPPTRNTFASPNSPNGSMVFSNVSLAGRKLAARQTGLGR